MKKVAFLDTVHPVLNEGLVSLGFECFDLTLKTKNEILEMINDFEGIVIRSRFPLDEGFLIHAKKLEFIARSGAGLENIDEVYCQCHNVQLFNAPEGNRNAVGEHALGMLLALFNKLCIGNSEIRNGVWQREGNRGIELDGKTVGIIGFGNNGSAFARKLKGFDVEILAYDKYKTSFGTNQIKEVDIEMIFEKADVVSFHIPQNSETMFMVNSDFLNRFKKPVCIINLSRGKIIKTDDLVEALKKEAVLGACLDVLEYEKGSFEDFFTNDNRLPESFEYLIESNRVILSPHVGGWTEESYFKLSKVLLKKIESFYNL